MPNIGTLLRDEISRLSRKEIRSQVDSTRKATTQHRRDISALKRQVAQLERQVTLLSRRVPGAPTAAPPAPGEPRVRFVAKGLRSQRVRLGLSASDFGRLLGVSAQSIYNWERGLARPRAEQLAKLTALRAVGKREAGKQLAGILAAQGRGSRGH
jgi:DNA-binding XRE family transcriptional regulator